MVLTTQPASGSRQWSGFREGHSSTSALQNIGVKPAKINGGCLYVHLAQGVGAVFEGVRA